MPARPVPAYGAPPERDTLLGGRYRLQAPIGSGGTADVSRGVDQVLGREVAVKVFRAGADTVTADRFCDEARTLARLSHPALVTVYDAGRHGQGAFMVTELIRGVTLRTRIDAGPLSPVQVTRLGAAISSALDHVHAHGIIHHDVKPSNVLLREDGSPHLADFGLSRTVHDRSHSAPETLVGTLAYMAPEQLLGQGASTASDVYALGVTLLEALTGYRDYQGTPVEAGTAHLLHPPRVPEGLPTGLGRLLKAMTDPDPQARPDAAGVHLRLQDIAYATESRASVSAARTDTSTHRSPLPPLAAARSGAEPVGPPAPTEKRTPARRRAAVMSLAAVSVAGACALLMGGVPAGEKTPPTAPSRDQPPASKEAEGAGPQPTSPAPPIPTQSASGTPELPVAAPSTAAELPTFATPADSYSQEPGGDRPAKAPRPAKSKDNPEKAKGNKDKGR
ncbi:protein kinase [Streptomyces sp. NPDC003038]|uniref:serine/threonine-protein kinase n=1 Tax=unclassified Streptomyces TaxID=2593676 RepID=UPI0033A81E30